MPRTAPDALIYSLADRLVEIRAAYNQATMDAYEHRGDPDAWERREQLSTDCQRAQHDLTLAQHWLRLQCRDCLARTEQRLPRPACDRHRPLLARA